MNHPGGRFHASARRFLMQNDGVNSIFRHLHAGPDFLHAWYTGVHVRIPFANCVCSSGGRVGPRGSFHASARRFLLQNYAVKSIFQHLYAGFHFFYDWCYFLHGGFVFADSAGHVGPRG